MLHYRQEPIASVHMLAGQRGKETMMAIAHVAQPEYLPVAQGLRLCRIAGAEGAEEYRIEQAENGQYVSRGAVCFSQERFCLPPACPPDIRRQVAGILIKRAASLGMPWLMAEGKSPLLEALGFAPCPGETGRYRLPLISPGQPELSPYVPEDCPALIRLFTETVHSVCARDYTPAQLAAWTGGASVQSWGPSLLAHDTLVARLAGKIVGFGDMAEAGYLDRLYVHRDAQGRGVGRALVSALQARSGCRQFTVHASETALPFFQAMGYRILRRQTVERAGVRLHNYHMALAVEH